MSISQLFSISLIELILLIGHSYFKRGFRITFNFFLFAFIVAMRKEVGTFLLPSMAAIGHPTPFIHTVDSPLSFNVMNVTLGWMVVFYLSWCFAEKISDNLPYVRQKIFPTVLLAGITVASLSYAIEVTAINVGWWKWVFFDKLFAEFFVGGVHFFALSAWFYFSTHFLIPFFLIECSIFRFAEWKTVFFLIPFSRTCTMLFLGPHLARDVHEFIFFLLLVSLAFLKPLDFNYPEFRKRSINSCFLNKFIEAIPYTVIFIILSALIFIDLQEIKNARLLISLFPLISVVLLSIKNTPLLFMLLLTVLVFLVFGKVAIPAGIPLLVFLIFRGTGRAVC